MEAAFFQFPVTLEHCSYRSPTPFTSAESVAGLVAQSKVSSILTNLNLVRLV